MIVKWLSLYKLKGAQIELKRLNADFPVAITFQFSLLFACIFNTCTALRNRFYLT